MEEKIEGVFCIGDLVFAKVRGHPPWPGQVEGVAGKSSKEVKYDILFFGKFERATCKESDIFHFEVNKEKYGKSRRRGFLESFEQIEEAAREHASHMASSRELPEETPTNIMKKEKCSEIPIEGNSLPIPGSETAVLGDISVNQPNFILKEEPIESEETWRKDIKSELTSPSANNTKSEASDEMHWQDIKLKKTLEFDNKMEKPIPSDEGCSSHSHKSETHHHLCPNKASSSNETDTTRNSTLLIESRVSIHETNFVVKEEPECIEIKEEPLFPLSYNISCEEPLKRETLGEDIKEPRTIEMGNEKAETLSAGPSSHIFQSDIIDPLFKRKTSSFDETDTRSSASVMESKVSINQTNIVVKEEPAGIEVKDEPISSLSSSILCEEPVKNETLHGDILETGVSGMKEELEINSFVSFRSDAPGQLSLDIESGSYIGETQRPVMTLMDSTREFNGVTSCLGTAPSSSQSPLAEATGMSTQEHSSVLLQNLSSRTPLVMASCFTGTDRYLLERQDEEQIAGIRQRQEEGQMAGEKQRHEEVLSVGVRQKTLDNQSGSERGVSVEVILPEWEMQKRASVSCSNEKSVRKSKGEAFECSACKKYFPSKVLHTVEKAYMCSLCEKSFSHKHPATLHTGEKPYSCSQCQKSFSRRDHLKIHMGLHTGEKPYKCSRCEKSFSERSNLTMHMRLHTGEKPFQCSQCENSFRHKQSLTQHMRLHTGEKPFQCSQCEKTFSHKHYLTRHMRLHIGERPFQCSQCENSFRHKQSLTQHMRLHTGEKPFQCSQCENSFRHKQSLTQHMNLHTGEKPYNCTRCEKAFGQRGNLVRHMRLHTGEKPFQCSQCESSFTNKHHLTLHKRVHTREKPYKCSLCEKSFSDRSSLTRHMCIHK